MTKTQFTTNVLFFVILLAINAGFLLFIGDRFGGALPADSPRNEVIAALEKDVRHLEKRLELAEQLVLLQANDRSTGIVTTSMPGGGAPVLHIGTSLPPMTLPQPTLPTDSSKTSFRKAEGSAPANARKEAKQGEQKSPEPQIAVIAVMDSKLYYRAPDSNIHIARVGDPLFGVDGKFVGERGGDAVLILNGKKIVIPKAEFGRS